MKTCSTLLMIAVLSAGCFGPRVDEAQTEGASWSGVARIVAVGDVHGDFDQFEKILRKARVIDNHNRWIGGKTHLVQTGDILDRGPDSRKALDLLRRLEIEALKKGGRVHALIGNHEAMVCMGHLGFAHAGEIEAFGGEDGVRRAFGPQGEYGKWIGSNNAVIRINDVLFVHGGISPRYATQSLEQINASVRVELVDGGKTSQEVTGDNDGPLWYRGYAEEKDAQLKQLLAIIRKTFSVRHVVVGHTISKKGIQTRCDGQIIMIDVGFSKAYVGGRPAALLIEDGKFFSVTPAGMEELQANK